MPTTEDNGSSNLCETSQVFLQSIKNEKEGKVLSQAQKFGKGLYSVGWNVRNRYQLLQDIIRYCTEVYN